MSGKKLVAALVAALFAPDLRLLTDQQLGALYADLWTAANGPLVDAVFQHIAAQAQRIKELQN